jgi:hypothetical protein
MKPSDHNGDRDRVRRRTGALAGRAARLRVMLAALSRHHAGRAEPVTVLDMLKPAGDDPDRS